MRCALYMQLIILFSLSLLIFHIKILCACAKNFFLYTNRKSPQIYMRLLYKLLQTDFLFKIFVMYIFSLCHNFSLVRYDRGNVYEA